MLVVSSVRYLPLTVNTLVLYAQEKYFYVHRDVYDQAVILADRHPGFEELADLVGGSSVNRDTAQWFYAHAPKPIHSLAPFLLLVDGEIEREMELCCGVLHVITSLIHARHFIGKPQEIRKSVSFSLSIREEYELAWERFLMTALPYEERHTVFAAAVIGGSEAGASGLALSAGNENPIIAAGTAPDGAPVVINVAQTSLLDGFSVKKEELKREPEAISVIASAAERKATRSLLT